MASALSVAASGPDACRDASEQMALGRIYERAGRGDDAVRAYELAARSGDRDVRPHALARLASLLGRRGRHDEAAAAWEVVLEDSRRRGPLSSLARRAAEALAIHHEHRAKNLETARSYAEALHSGTGGRTQRDAAHRLGRLDRKLMAGQPGRRLDWETR
jgi:tetratricopeptide (TPR) repeat protein